MKHISAELANLLRIFAVLSKRSIASLCDEYGSARMPEFKEALAPYLVVRSQRNAQHESFQLNQYWNLCQDTVVPIGEKIKALRQKPQWVDDVLHHGASKARHIAKQNLKEVKEVIGML